MSKQGGDGDEVGSGFGARFGKNFVTAKFHPTKISRDSVRKSMNPLLH
jgi:hypothetical protein